MTIERITETYVDEWVLVGDPRTDMSANLLQGAVLFHSKDRDEVYAKARESAPNYCAIIFTGTVPRETAILL